MDIKFTRKGKEKMFIVTDSEKLQYELANIIRLFFPDQQVGYGMVVPDQPQPLVYVEGGLEFTLTLVMPNGEEFREKFTEKDSQDSKVMNHIIYGRLLYSILEKYTGRRIDWGVLTGIRPVKLAKKLRKNGCTTEEIENFFVDEYKTTQKKAELVAMTDSVQKDTVENALDKGFSLYVSIPFCPTRCSYCSFVSHSIERTFKLIPEYIEKLCQEIEVTGKIAKDNNLVLETIYIGGGTPTVLDAGQLEVLLDAIKENFDLSQCTEYTVEAGRPDTITGDKLDVLKKFGVDRLSVNCQTLNDSVLKEIGRNHSADEFFTAYNLVKSYGFIINVDLIAGLPSDGLESFKQTIDGVVKLAPDNITLHTLTVKKSATLKEQKSTILESRAESQSEVSQMVEAGQQSFLDSGYLPYYLYRQKGTVDSIENVGYCCGDSICKYNVYIMDEEHTILSVGGGGVTKVVNKGCNNSDSEKKQPEIIRIFNYKYPYEYINNFDEILRRKDRLTFYRKC